MIEFTIFRISVRVEVIFWITMGVFGVLWNQRQPSEMLVNAGLFVFAAFVSIMIHELGHALMIKKYGYNTEIVLSAFGGYATHSAGALDRKQVFLMTLAGPLVQLVAGLMVWKGVPLLIDLPNNKILVLYDDFIIISIFWAIFNCLPVLPLDGGRMVEAALGPRRIQTTLMVSMISAAVVGVAALGLNQIFIAVFMFMYGWQSYQAYERFK